MRYLPRGRYRLAILALLLTLCIVIPWSCSRGPGTRINEDSFALVVGSNNAMGERRLRYAVHDAEALAKELTDDGYKVVLLTDSCETPEDNDLPFTHWTQQSLADLAMKRGIIDRISQRSVGRISKRSGPEAAPRPLLADTQA